MSFAKSLRFALVVCLPMLVGSPPGRADTEGEKRDFDVSRSLAVTSLKQSAIQGSIEIFFTDSVVKGVVTPRIRGNYYPREALDILLADTPLEAVRDSESGVFAIVRRKGGKTENAAISNERRNSTENMKLDNLKVNTKKNFLKSIQVALSAAVLSGGSNAIGQDGDENEIYELSPFSVSGEDDAGYRATSTLAGTRIKSNLGDLASSISVLTTEFLDDTGSTDLEDSLVYVGNFEVAGMGGNYSGGEFNGQRVNNEGSVVNNTVTTRVRGLAGATTTRNYFAGAAPMDAYNVDRIVLNRGPNAILFGLGSPGGIINTQTLRAFGSNRSRFSAQFDQFGSQRYTFDFDRSIIENKLSVRIAALYEDEVFEQEPAFNRDKRIYATFNYRPLEYTSINASYENGSIDSNNPRNIPPVDLITRWFQNDKPSQNGATEAITGVNRTELSTLSVWFQELGYRVGPNGEPAGNAVHGLQDARVGGGAFGAFMGTPGLADTRGRVDTMYQELLPDGSGRTYADRLFETTGVTMDELAWSVSPSVTDRSIFDYRKILIDGDTKFERADIENLNVTIEQLFLDGNAGIEIAYDEQVFDRVRQDGVDAGGNRGNAIYIDGTTIEPNGQPNPNYGRPVLYNKPGGSINELTDSAFRATAFYNVDFSEKLDGRLGSILGSHSFTGLYTDAERDSKGVGYRPHVQDEATTLLRGRRPSNVTNNDSMIGIVHYLGDSLVNASSPSDANITRGMVGSLPTSFPANIHTNRTTTYTDTTVTPLFNVPTSGVLDLQTAESLAAVWQGKMFGDTVVPMIGWRQDNANSYRNGSPPRDDLRIVLPNDPSFVLPEDPDVDSGDLRTWSYGLVVHSPEFINEQLPAGMRLSGHYNESENFQIGGARFDILGNNVPPAGGTTEEFGFSASFMDRKFEVRANWFETIQTNGQNSQLSALDGSVIADERRFAQAYLNNDIEGTMTPEQFAAYTRPSETFRDLVGWTETLVEGVWSVDTSPPNIVSPQAIVSEGMEVDVIYNPTSNWRIMFNAAQQEAVQSGIGADYEALFAERNPQMWKNPILQDWAFQGLNTVVNSSLGFDRRLASAQLTNGRKTDQIREWRWNLVTNYTFAQDSKLDGFSVGGAVRWQDVSIIGYGISPDPLDPDGVIQDINKPIAGPTETNIDVWVGYETALTNKVDMRIKLNVRNLNSGDGLIPVYANPNGQAAIYRIEQPRLFQLRTDFEF